MIVMKFGGSSLRSAATFEQVAAIIKSNKQRQPVIVASAIGDTTDHLQAIAEESRKGHAHRALALLDTLQNEHFEVAAALLDNARYAAIEAYFKKTFRNLHVRVLEAAEGERDFTPAFQDSILSLGEQLSSRLLAEVLDDRCGPAAHLDARVLILTNDNFTKAEPLYWETCANIRWSVPILARDKLVVVGGFIGGTRDGLTTTLGRGGSDLTASVIGAAINADEIQVWKDVDGMLTCDPRIFSSGLQVKRLSYLEAAELARSGATILHPKTMEPAKRLRIPIVIRNTFHPKGEETRIEMTDKRITDDVKSIAVRQTVSLLEISPATVRPGDTAFRELLDRLSAVADVLYSSENIAYVAAAQNTSMGESAIPRNSCFEVRLRSRQAIVTLVGSGFCEGFEKRIGRALRGLPFFLLPFDKSNPSVKLSVPQDQLKLCVERLHEVFFSNPDPRLFVRSASSSEVATQVAACPRRRSQRRTTLTASATLQLN